LRAYKNFKMVDVKAGKVVENCVILVEGEYFKEVGADVDIPEGVETVDLVGKTVLPGIIDAHIHSLSDGSADPHKVREEENDAFTIVKAVRNMEKTLQSGVTHIRGMGASNFYDLGLRDAEKAGFLSGPRMQVSGRCITMTGGHGYKEGREADGTAEVRKAAREQLKAGVDVVKIMATGGVMTRGVEPGSPQLTEEEIRAAVEEAHKAGRKTATHAQGTEGIKNAVRAGIDSVEHGIFLDKEVVEMMAERGTFLVATLVAPYWIVEYGVENGVPEFAVEKSKKLIDDHMNSFRMAKEAGVKIAMGTDAGTPFNKHGKNTYELKKMVEAGMTPLEAVQAATLGGAELLEVEDVLGSIEAGKYADMVVVDGNPLDNVEDVFNVEAVYKAGSLVAGTC
jgi:imidazolonepropionase-like amidohydrolase